MVRNLFLLAALVVIAWMIFKLIRPGDRQLAVTKKALREVDRGRLHIEPFDIRSVPPACHPAAEAFVACGFSVMGAIVTRKRKLPDSYSILLLDGNALTYARATAIADSTQASFGVSSYLLDGRKLDTSASNMGIADPQVIAQLLPDATIPEIVAAHRRRLLEQQAKDNPARPIDPERLPDLVLQSWKDDAAGIKKFGVTYTSNDADPKDGDTPRAPWMR